MKKSRHYETQRNDRNLLIGFIGEGKVIYETTCFDKKRNKNFRYQITDNAILKVLDEKDDYLITKMVARPSRILRYWKDAPEWLIMKSVDYTRKGYHI